MVPSTIVSLNLGIVIIGMGNVGIGDSGLVLANLQHLADYTLRSRELERFNGG